MLLVSCFCISGCRKSKKSGVCDCCWDSIFIGNVNNIYDNLTVWRRGNHGVVLLEYTIQGNNYTFMKRSVKRSIFIQIMLFSMNGIYTLFKDRKQELMIFATGNIYRKTGTASKEISEKKSLSKKIEVVCNEKKVTGSLHQRLRKDLKTRDRKASRNEKKETSMNRSPAEVEVLNYNKCYE